MRIIRAVLLSGVIASTFLSSVSADTKEKTQTPQFADVIFDPAAFTSMLPKHTLIIFTSPENKKLVAEGIKALGPVPDIEFFNLPAGSEVPVIKDQPHPKFPKGFGDHGEASLLVAIDASGKVSAIYCFQASHKAFAINAAAAVVQWRFSPAKIQQTPVTVLFAETINFDTDWH